MEIPKTERGSGLFIQPVHFDHIVSSGSTLLDLAVSGSRASEGGIPAGIVMEIFGQASSGKTAILSSIAAQAQSKGGSVLFADPEGRLDKEYARIYGMSIKAENYAQPDFVTDLLKMIWEFKSSENSTDVFIADSIAALSTKMEMDSDEGDKMGGKKAKDLHQLMRKTCRKIAKSNLLVAFSNQLHDSMSAYGGRTRTPGGHAIPFYASLRLEIKVIRMIEEELSVDRAILGSIREAVVLTGSDKKSAAKKISKITGVEAVVRIVKSTVDDPFRTAPVRILFGYGIDDVGANLQWLKTIAGLSKYLAVDKEFIRYQSAINYIEEMSYEKKLREQVSYVWHGIEHDFRERSLRKPKQFL